MPPCLAPCKAFMTSIEYFYPLAYAVPSSWNLPSSPTFLSSKSTHLLKLLSISTCETAAYRCLCGFLLSTVHVLCAAFMKSLHSALKLSICLSPFPQLEFLSFVSLFLVCMWQESWQTASKCLCDEGLKGRRRRTRSEHPGLLAVALRCGPSEKREGKSVLEGHWCTPKAAPCCRRSRVLVTPSTLYMYHLPPCMLYYLVSNGEGKGEMTVKCYILTFWGHEFGGLPKDFLIIFKGIGNMHACLYLLGFGAPAWLKS